MRARILAAVGALIMRDGLAGVGINALARAAGCDKVLIYRYFGDLDGVYAAYAAKSDFWWTVEDLTEGLDPSRTSLAAALKTMLRRHAEALRARPITLAVLAAELTNRTALVVALETLRERRALQASAWIGERYRLPPGLDFEAVSHADRRRDQLSRRSRPHPRRDERRPNRQRRRLAARVRGDRRDRRCARARRLIFLLALSPIGDEQMEMAMTAFASNRRDILRAGGATLFLALAGGRLRAADSAGRPLPEGDAYAPWTLWNDPSIRNTPLALVAAGVIAANPHDTQPWLFAVSDDTIEIFADTSRNLGAMDACIREMHLGLGCAIENMLTAAGANGYAAELETAPGSLIDLNERSRPVLAARLRLRRIAEAAPDPRYAAIPLRHTNRYAYDPARAPTADWRDFARALGADGEVKLSLFDAGSPQRRLFDAAVVEATRGDHRRQADDRRQRPLVPRLRARDRRPSRRADARRRRPLDLHA